MIERKISHQLVNNIALRVLKTREKMIGLDNLCDSYERPTPHR